MCSEALISECSSLHSCALMHEPVLLTEVHTSVQVHASVHMYYTTIDHTWVEQSKCLSSVRGSSSVVSSWTQDHTSTCWHGFQSHLGQLIFIKNLSLIFSVNTKCHYLLESFALISLYRNELLIIHKPVFRFFFSIYWLLPMENDVGPFSYWQCGKKYP